MDAHEESVLDRIAELIETHNGYCFHGARKRILQTRIHECLEEMGLEGTDAFHQQLLTEAAQHGPSWQRITDATINGESSWFRHPEQFKTLLDYILPAAVSNREFSGCREIRILSAGCSKGQEPYSIALTILDSEDIPPDFRIVIVACDICSRSLEAARQGMYREPEMRGLSPEQIKRYFEPSGEYWRLIPPIRKMVQFHKHNLLHPWEIDDFDIVFCRNVTIYFGAEKTKRTIENLTAILRPGGHLFAGHAETYSGMIDNLKPIWFGPSILYRRPYFQPELARNTSACR